MKHCGICVYYSGDRIDGDCVRFPPSNVGNKEHYAEYPTVRIDGYCGEFKSDDAIFERNYNAPGSSLIDELTRITYPK